MIPCFGEARAQTRSSALLWEVRSNLLRGRIARTIFCIEKEHLILLHGFIKKTQKTPPGEIDLALKRKREGV